MLGTLSKFKLENMKNRKEEVAWQHILRWWLDPESGVAPSTPSDISEWYDYVYRNFLYKFNWGLGSIISLAWDEVHGLNVESTLQDWPLLQLPWVVFWMKELITWGTLDPVAAYLLAKNTKTTRKDAEEAATEYYTTAYHPDPDELLNASLIRNWVDSRFRSPLGVSPQRPPRNIPVTLLRDFGKVSIKTWKVIPAVIEDKIQWLDPAGFPLAMCDRPKLWESSYSRDYDFTLDASNKVVASTPYL